jgi:hypothetical protein
MLAKPSTPLALPPVEVVVLDEELELLEELLEEELDELDELEELEDDELVELVEPVVEPDELEELELLLELEEFDELELEDELLDEELELPVPLPGIEHSFTPPGTRVPAPKVVSEQTKLPLSILKVKRSARP